MKKIFLTSIFLSSNMYPTMIAANAKCTRACSASELKEKVETFEGTLSREASAFLLDDKTNKYVLEIPDHLQGVALLNVNTEVEVKGVLQENTIMDLNVIKVKNIVKKR